ncbi:carbohydrate ABC transporter permease [Paenibacillus macquariensis]|uniref:Carbohydrate ABC transporter membrane protein 2, CUT1 family n=1 Tax=Paenibacillus macquariensis TaxID=948756 RepID=A0ABY1JW53_9BACL|nr:carbohydrate ABC transporter permease [Paenibacillus macquariensis]MEC0093465.1 carbohydrate ABC transporter permease [Paenibacillus macquariensis]OAB34400.1 ABC transporter permease [Paenibacillus macquariensis subsp. macquariensis]SIQ87332.1 carbohydrate ABC transporter membrane protein 2, CUT1 family [Paenibacillus macquariensis]
MIIRRNNRSVWSRAGSTANYTVLALFSLIALYPLWYVIVSSFSSSRAITAGEVSLWPVEFNIQAYLRLFDDGQLFVAMGNTIVVTLVGTLLNMVLTTLAAYPLSRKRLKGRNLLLMFIIFTMLFTTGVIPNFILVKSLGLMDTYWSLWFPALISTYNMFVMKTFMEGLPEEIEESAAIDGAGDWRILVQIILPLCKPIMAALSLFYAVSWWNSYFNVLLYITKSTQQTLTLKLYQMILQVNQSLLNNGSEGVDQVMLTPEGIKAAAIVIAVTPILIVYPFLQKHFVKGVLIGSVKG